MFPLTRWDAVEMEGGRWGEEPQLVRLVWRQALLLYTSGARQYSKHAVGMASWPREQMALSADRDLGRSS